MQQIKWRWPQFRLSNLFIFTAASAVCALVYRETGFWDAVGVATLLALIAVGIHTVDSRWRWLRYGVVGIAVMMTWILSVDYLLTYECCEHCSHSRFVSRYRLCGISLRARAFDHNHQTLRLIAEDLGAACPHSISIWRRLRFRGLVWPTEAICGITGFSGGREWYTPEVRALVKQRGASDPELGKQFQQALVEHDYVAIRTIVQKLKELESDLGSGG